MKFFKLKNLLKSWSVQIWSLVPVLATIDFSTTWLDGFIPAEYKPVVYGVLASVGLLARSVKQTNLSK